MKRYVNDFGDFMNDVGYVQQWIGMGTPYDWTATFTIYTAWEDKV